MIDQSIQSFEDTVILPEAADILHRAKEPILKHRTDSISHIKQQSIEGRQKLRRHASHERFKNTP